MCALAEGGQILAGEVARTVGRRRVALEFASLGELPLWAYSDPMPMLGLQWN